MSAKRAAAAADLTIRLAALHDMTSDELRVEWRRVYRSHPPKRTSRDLLVLAISWKLQVRVYGGLTPAQKKKLSALAEELRENGDLSGGPAIRVKPGSKLVREWQGETHTVLVLEDGFEWQGKCHQSLSSVAQEITGAHWSGPRFFGLRRKPKPFSGEERINA